MNLAGAAALATFVALTAIASARADDFTLDDVTIASPLSVYRARAVEFTGSALSREETRKVLDAGDPASGADRLARLDAARIVIPELVAETKGDGYRQTIVYRDVAATRVAHGVAQFLDAAGATIETARAGETMRGKFGALHAESVDFPALARIVAEPRKDDAAKRRTIARLSLDGLEIVPSGGERVRIGRIEGKDFNGRALAAPMRSLVDLSARADAKPPSPEGRRAIAAMLGDIVTSFDAGSFVMSDIAVTKVADEAARPLALIKRVALEGIMDGKIGAFSLEGLEAGDAAASVKIDRLAIAGLDLKTALAGAAALNAKQTSPHFDRIELSGLSVVGAGSGASDPFALKRLTIDATDWKALLPTRLHVGVDGAAGSLAGVGIAPGPALAAIGYDRFDFTGAIDARYDATKGELTIDKISGADPQLGAIRLSAVLSRVPASLFDGEPGATRAALLAVALWRADLRLTDNGALGKLAAANAAKTGRTPADARADMARAARALVHTLFSAPPGADAKVETVAEAASAFAGGASVLEVSASAANGLSLVDLAVGAQLGTLADQLRLDAKAH